MTKADLVEIVAKEADMTKKDVEQLVEIIFDSIVGTLNRGEKIELRGFGSFRVRERSARKGRNPKTGEPVDIPAKRVAYFYIESNQLAVFIHRIKRRIGTLCSHFYGRDFSLDGAAK